MPYGYSDTPVNISYNGYVGNSRDGWGPQPQANHPIPPTRPASPYSSFKADGAPWKAPWISKIGNYLGGAYGPDVQNTLQNGPMGPNRFSTDSPADTGVRPGQAVPMNSVERYRSGLGGTQMPGSMGSMPPMPYRAIGGQGGSIGATALSGYGGRPIGQAPQMVPPPQQMPFRGVGDGSAGIGGTATAAPARYFNPNAELPMRPVQPPQKKIISGGGDAASV